VVAEKNARAYLEPIVLHGGQQLNATSYDHWRQDPKSSKMYHEHETPRVFVEHLFRHLAQVSELSEETVRNNFIDGYYNSSKSEGFRELLDETFGEGFTAALRDVSSSEELKGLAEQYEFPLPTVPLQARLKEKLRALFGAK
jgi:hypothetical protein